MACVIRITLPKPISWEEDCEPSHYGIHGILTNFHFFYSPIVPGHEIIGRVAAVGPDESFWNVGDRIGGTWHGGHDGMYFYYFLDKPWFP